MGEDPKIHPTWLYHPDLAPDGKLFQSPDETKGLWRKGWVDTPTKFPKRVRPGARGFIDRYRRLTIWNQLAVWGSGASLLSIGLYFLPASEPLQQSTTVVGDQATILQPGRDLIVQPPAAPRDKRLLLPQQLRLLELVEQLQKQYAANRIIVSRTDGTLHFDDDRNRGAGVNLVQQLFGEVSLHNAGRFEELVLSMPSEYLRLASETRLDSPFVLSITEAGVEYLAAQ